MTLRATGLATASNCRACGGPMPRQKPGQERFYCSPVCRRRAEYVTRRLDKLSTALDKLEIQRRQLEVSSRRDSYWRADLDRILIGIRAHREQIQAVRRELAGEKHLQEVSA